jgi:hypothetical protein
MTNSTNNNYVFIYWEDGWNQEQDGKKNYIY